MCLPYLRSEHVLAHINKALEIVLPFILDHLGCTRVPPPNS